MVAPLTTEEVEGVAGHPDQCPLAKVCHGEALPWPTLQGHVGIKVPVGTLLVVRKGMYGGVARVPPELEGGGQVVEWRQVREYAALTDFVCMAAEDELGAGRPQEGGGQRHVPMSPGVKSARYTLLQPLL